MKTGRPTIAIDMDGVIADTIQNFLTYYERETGQRLDRSVFVGKHEFEALPGEAVRRYVHMPGFFRSAPVMDGAREALLELSANFDIYIVSAAMEFPQSLPEKKEWLTEYFEFITWRNIVFCGDKSIICTDYLVDDHPKNLDTFRGKAIMYTAEHNIGKTGHTRVNDWSEAVTVIHDLAGIPRTPR